MRSMSVLVLVLGVSLLTPSAVAAQEAAPSPAPSDGLAPNAARPLTHDELLAIRGEQTRDDATLGMLVADAVIVRSPDRTSPTDWPVARASGSSHARGTRASRRASRRCRRRPVSGRRAHRGPAGHRAPLQRWPQVPRRGRHAGRHVPHAHRTAGDGGSRCAASRSAHRGAGWFSRLASPQPCPEVPDALDPNDAGGRSSPFVRCPGGWLTTDPVTEVDSGDATAPLSFGIPVQYGALERFGATWP